MGRLALRPGIRANAHAQAGATGDTWENTTSISYDGVDEAHESSAVGFTDSAYSVSMWFKLDSLAVGSYGPMLFSVGTAAGTWNEYRTMLYFNRTVGQIRVREGSGATRNSLNSSVIPSLDTWYHLALTSSGDGAYLGVKIYLDGAEVASFTGLAAGAGPYTWRLYLGMINQTQTANKEHFAGNIDEVMCFDSELSASAVADIYNAPDDVPLDPSSIGLSPVHYYRMGDLTDTDGASGVIYDRGSGGIDLDTFGGDPQKDSDVPS